MRSVLHANGAIPFARCASAIRTSQPASSSWSCTNRAPVIDSIAASTGPPCSRSTSHTKCASPSRSGGHAPTPSRSPSTASACQSRRLRLRSNPTYNTVGPPSLITHRSLSGEPEALLHRIHQHVGEAGRAAQRIIEQIRQMYLHSARANGRVVVLTLERRAQKDEADELQR